MEKLLITGISGGQGRLVTRLAADEYDVCGVDRDEMLAFSDGTRVRVYVLDLMKKKFEDVFRHEHPTAVIHLAFVRHFRLDVEQRHEVNLLGTKRVLEYCATYGVRQLTVVSSAYAYGALPDNPSYVDEDHPLNVSRTYPEVRDLAEVDTLCSAFLWQHPEVRTAILRPVNTLGDSVHSAIGRYLRLRWVPMLMGFDPMLQFIHEEDLARAILLTLERKMRGIFNVAGPGAVPLHVAVEQTGGTPLTLPEQIARPVVRRLFDLGLYPFPPGAIDFIKYPCTVSDSRFVAATGFKPKWSLHDIFAQLREERERAAA
ncbi:MAG TPA: NAD-dependent epimerase/dehydratase family protein [Candidatus Binatia bacterium]|nr:NAD-dependent epimerase/dehydratase family protein [Candidatus Binatia bacterium]